MPLSPFSLLLQFVVSDRGLGADCGIGTLGPGIPFIISLLLCKKESATIAAPGRIHVKAAFTGGTHSKPLRDGRLEAQS